MKRILIVNHSVQRCLDLSDFIGNMGFETGVADTYSRALKMLEEADPLPDFILLDIGPNGDAENWRLYNKLQKSKFKNIPVIFMNEECVISEVKLDEESSFLRLTNSLSKIAQRVS